MRFLDWLKAENLTLAQAADRVGAANATDARRLLYGQIPRPERMRRIYVASAGQVTPNDFYDLPEIIAPPAARQCEGDHTAAPNKQQGSVKSNPFEEAA